MRIVIKLETERGYITLPVHYNHLVQSMIYRSLNRALADWLHDEGYPFGKRKFKLFTFSRLRAKERKFDRENRTITFSSPIYLKIGAYETEFLESLAVYLVKNGEIRLGRSPLNCTSIEVEMRVVPDGPILVKAISPITVYSTLLTPDGKKKTYFYNPREKEFEKLILDNLRRKAKSIYGDKQKLPSLDDAYIKPVKISREILVNFKGTWIKGFTGIFELYLPEPYFTIAYDTGLGSKNPQGFGMVEAVRGGKAHE